LKNYLEDLKIKCEHHDRGCPDVVRLEDLQRHVDQCGFAPVICGNKECGTEVNRRDQRIHERELCEFRIAKCHDCRDIKASQNGMKVQITQMEEQMKVRSDFLRSFATIKIKIVFVNLLLERNFTRYLFTVRTLPMHGLSKCIQSHL
jgi:E3 ubiquitin-protein ligase NRDP1